MYEDYNNYRDPKKPYNARSRIWAAIGAILLVPLVAVIGIYVGDVAQKKSVDFRTDAETEVHRVLGESYIHLGDDKPVKAVPIGKVFYVHTKYIKTETCSAHVSNVFWDFDSHIVFHYSMFTNWFKAGTYEANEAFPVPDYIPEGNYHVIKKTVSNCNGREHYSVNFDLVVRFYRPKPDTKN